MITVFTTCALNFLPSAKQLLRSIREHLPNTRTVLGIADRRPPHFEPHSEGVDEIIGIEDLRDDFEGSLESWIFRHDVMELSTAMKGFVLDRLLQRDDCEAVLFFDADCVLFSPVRCILDEFSGASILLTPHACVPHTNKEWYFFELGPLRVGSFNLGFLGVRNDETGRAFSRWWKERLRHFCLNDPARFLFTDQKWIDLVPSYFDSVRVLRQPTFNLARWNTFQRHVEFGSDGGVLVDGQPVGFIHYSGFYKTGDYVQGLYDRDSEPFCKELGVLQELSSRYAKAIADESKRDICRAPWGYGLYSDGTPIEHAHRVAYRSDPRLAERFPDPFDRSTTDNFLRHYQQGRRSDTAMGSAGDLQSWKRRAEVAERELRGIHQSRSWKLVQLMRRVAAPLRGR